MMGFVLSGFCRCPETTPLSALSDRLSDRRRTYARDPVSPKLSKINLWVRAHYHHSSRSATHRLHLLVRGKNSKKT